jgi:formylglycine-generating enzyme required for sulfatase activity
MAAWLLAGRWTEGERVAERAPGPTVLSALHQVELGSTSGEFRDAIGLCRLTAPDCDASWLTSEDPIRTVLAPYALDRHEVTNREFRAFVERTGHVTDAERRGASYHQFVEVPGLSWRAPAPGVQGIDPARPVVHVSHADAEAFCAAAGMRLPTQDEWEFAARGDARRVFPWGDAWDPERAVWGLSSYDGVEAVDSRRDGAGPFGQLHLAGNVAEWTATATGGDRIIKGGAWSETNPARLRAAARVAESPDYTSSDLGFRCASEPAPGGG